MNLDEALKLARKAAARDCCARPGSNHHDENVLARAVLAMAPVVVAAHEWRTVERCDITVEPFASECWRAIDKLGRAVNALSTLSSKVPHGE